MGINPTALYKTFTFGGESSADYGAFLTGEGVFNAPERAVEMIEVPGRNGSFAMDMGRFENVELTYNASIVDYTSADFADRISALRNWLCSKRGYVRLEDEYNPDEYRMAVYKSGLEVDHEGLLTGEFDITFDCKPQRYLKSGETAVSVTSGDTITNPTLFESSPLLAVEGYGHISMNGHELDLYDRPLGSVDLYNIGEGTKYFGQYYQHSFDGSHKYSNSIKLDNLDLLNNGDSISIPKRNFDLEIDSPFNKADVTITASSGCHVYYGENSGEWCIWTNFDLDDKTVLYGTADSWGAYIQLKEDDTYSAQTRNVDIAFDIAYDGDDTISTEIVINEQINESSFTFPPIIGYSTISTLGHPSYIDCEIGEAYMYVDDEMVELNNVTSFGSDLPTLAVGTNTITYDNTITDLKIYPRWWRV